MEHIKTVKERKKTAVIEPSVESESANVIYDEKFCVTMTVDNSLKRFANDPFVTEQRKKAERKFAEMDPYHLFLTKKPV